MTTGVAAPTPILQFSLNNGQLAAGGSLLTTVGGINAATYQDVGLTTPLPNPIPLNSRGEVSNASGASCQLFLTPNTVYVFTLFDAKGNQIWQATYINGVQVVLTQASIGAIFYPQSAAELAVSVTPTNFWYPPMYVDRYGTNANPGTTDMSGAFNTAIAVAKVAGGTVHFGQTGQYAVTNPINGTSGPTDRGFGLTIHCDNGMVPGNFAPGPTIVANHLGHVFDFTGTMGLIVENVSITTGTNHPLTAFFQARLSTGSSVGISRFKNCSTLGTFTVAAYYNYGAEDDQIDGCYFQNNAAGGKVYYFTGNNAGSLNSTFQTVATGAQSCIDHKIFGGEIYMQNASATSDCIAIEQSDSVKIYGPWMNCSDGTNGGRALIYIDMTFAASNFCHFLDITGENPGTLASRPQFGVLFSNHAQTPSGFSIRSCKLPARTKAVGIAGGLPTIDSFIIEQIAEITSLGISLANVQKSFFDTAATLISLGASTNNVLIGFSDAWTVSSRVNDMWIDEGTVNKAFTPALGTVTHGGALTFNETRYQLNGNTADFEFVMTDTVSITATAAQTITGLPFASARRSASIQVANLTTGVAIGAGVMDTAATAIKMPAFTVGAGVSVVVSGRYFVA